jgi:raffinose/stachyose/melibiose transport system permease protein
MHPTRGLINPVFELFGTYGPDWLGNVNLALASVVFVDVWRGVGLATVIYIAGIMSIDKQNYEAADLDGAGRLKKFLHITVPLCRPAMVTVIILSFIGGLRTFDLVWVMTGGGPGFTTELMTSAIFKLFSQGIFGLATAGNVIMFLMVSLLAYPLFWWLNRRDNT